MDNKIVTKLTKEQIKLKKLKLAAFYEPINKEHKDKYIDIIKKHHNALWLPQVKLPFLDYDDLRGPNKPPNSWYTIKHHKSPTKTKFKPVGIHNDFEDQYTNSTSVELVLNAKQKYIIDCWFKSTTDIHNQVIDYVNLRWKIVKSRVKTFNEFSIMVSKLHDFIVIMRRNFRILKRNAINFRKGALKDEVYDINVIEPKINSIFNAAVDNFQELETKHNLIKSSYKQLKAKFNKFYDDNADNKTFVLKKAKENGITKLENVFTNYKQSNIYKTLIEIELVMMDVQMFGIKARNIIISQQNIINLLSNETSKFKTRKLKINVFSLDNINLNITQDDTDKYKITKRYPLNIKKREVRSLLFHEKKDIQKISIPNDNPHELRTSDRIKINVLDATIAIACANCKSVMTNYARFHIHKFRFRHLRYSRQSKIMRLESKYYGYGTIFNSILGKLDATYDKNPFDLTMLVANGRESVLRYVKKLKKYYLDIPEYVDSVQNTNQREFISIDPGIREFLTCLSEDEVIKICSQDNKVLRKVEQLRNCRNIPSKSKRRYKMSRYEKKIKNLVDDMHWKVIAYLTTKYRNILIGNMGTKSIISNNNDFQLSSLSKVYISRLRLSTFRTRLEHKCNLKRINYKMVDERYTSKICSMCGTVKEDLGGDKIYNCGGCKKVIDRDVNGSRGIYLKCKYYEK